MRVEPTWRQPTGIALILLVWINYFSRVVVLAACWAHTSPEARAIRDASDDDCTADQKLFDTSGGRSGIRHQAALCALDLLMP